MRTHSQLGRTAARLALALAAGCLSVLGGCGRAVALPPVSALPPVAEPQPQPILPDADVPSGWRELKFGMSEQEVARIILRYRSSPANRWEQASVPRLPTVLLDADAIDATAVDPIQFHEWSIADLDDGAGLVRAWHEDGELVAIEVSGKARPEVFEQLATQAYGPPARHAWVHFNNYVTGVTDTREVSIWRSGQTAAFVWKSNSLLPTLLLWSNGPMARRASRYQAALAAPAIAAKSIEEAKAMGTKF
jgi:hypothetical protein